MIRRSYAGDRCTIRFEGYVPEVKSEAFGVEWDDATRGKNSGDVNGKKYFECRIAGAGSFLRKPVEWDPEQSLSEAIESKYFEEHKFNPIPISGGKTAVLVGEKKMFAQLADPERLRTISVSGGLVNVIDSLPYTFYKLERLDLSDNLFTSIRSLCIAIKPLSIRSLCLNGNRFDDLGGPRVESIVDLQIARTLLSKEEIEAVLNCFPNVDSLSIAYNRLTSTPTVNVSNLDISNNELLELPFAKVLNASYNSITGLTKPVQIPVLHLMGHKLEWKDIDCLAEVSELWLTHEDDDRPFIIGRCAALQKLNGTPVSPEERLYSEKHTWARVCQNTHPILPPERWNELISKFGERLLQTDESMKSRIMTINVNGSEFRVLSTMTIARLKLLVARKSNLDPAELVLSNGHKILDPMCRICDCVTDGSFLIATY